MIVNLGNPDETVLTFGKYKGLQPKYLADRDPSYIVWIWECHNDGEAIVSKELYERCRREMEGREEDDDDQEEVKTVDTFMRMAARED
jgi:hypothetical protein